MVQITPPKILIIWELLGEVIPKARPRVSKGGAYLPPKYAAWKDEAVDMFRIAAYQERDDIRAMFPLSGVAISVVFYGKALNPKSDLDNAIGSILDALVQADVLKDDSRNHVKKLSVEYVNACAKKEGLTEIKIEVV